MWSIRYVPFATVVGGELSLKPLGDAALPDSFNDLKDNGYDSNVSLSRRLY